MEIGTLNCRLEIQEMQGGVDPIGQPLPETWTTIHTVWGSIRHLSGLETIKAQASVSIVQASIRIRYLPGIDAGMRVKHQETIYDIQAVMPDATGRQYTDLVAQTVT